MITVMAVGGVALGVTILVVVSAVTTGFQTEFREKVLGVNAHALVLKYGVDFTEYRDVMKTAERLPGVVATAPFLFNTMMMQSGSGITEVLVKGIDPVLSPAVLDLRTYLTPGSENALARLTPRVKGGPAGTIIGRALAERLRVQVGDTVSLLSPLSSLDPGIWSPASSAPSSRDFVIVGIFDSGFMEYDARLVYVDLPAAQSFYDHGDAVMGVEMRVDDVWKATDVAVRLDEALGGYPYRTMDWRELNHNLFQALALQKFVLLLVFSLVVLVAGINIVSTLHLVVISKRRAISILKAAGAPDSGILRIFLIEGLFIGVIGAALGSALGVAVCWLLKEIPFPLDPRVYLIRALPIALDLVEVAQVAALVVFFVALAALFPAYKAAQLRPVDGLRYD
ncbi:MAG TPA: ABC transporter permease [Myxococcota bacterium]|jgi:lipoprotein-releasing system permease protein|nr:ABC transporter permease [Myxococcota bacterium]